jgi:hypothetical protein
LTFSENFLPVASLNPALTRDSRLEGVGRNDADRVFLAEVAELVDAPRLRRVELDSKYSLSRLRDLAFVNCRICFWTVHVLSLRSAIKKRSSILHWFDKQFGFTSDEAQRWWSSFDKTSSATRACVSRRVRDANRSESSRKVLEKWTWSHVLENRFAGIA